MEKLRRERETYFLWKSGEKDLQRLNKLLRAYDYFTKNRALKERKDELAICLEQVDEKKADLRKLK